MKEINSCWLEIGVWGNGSCELLQQNIHCANCTKFEEAGTFLFDREAPEGYLDEWNEILSKGKNINYYTDNSYLFFRVGNEWFAIQIRNVTYITELRTIHSLPGKTTTLIKGITNIRGELKIVVDIKSVLNIDQNESYSLDLTKKVYKRMCVLSIEKDVWVFEVDEIMGIKKIQNESISPVPATIKKSSANYLMGILRKDSDTFVGILDEKKLYMSINKNIY